MRISFRSGIVALCVTALAPFANALTVTQSFDFSGSDSRYPVNYFDGINPFSNIWNFTRPVTFPGLTLQSIDLTVVAQTSVFVWDTNPFQADFTWSTFASFRSSVYTPLIHGSPTMIQSTQASATSPTLPFPSGKIVNWQSPTFETSLTLRYTDAASFEWFTYPTELRVGSHITTSSGYGGATGYNTGTATLVFTYGVPDSGSTVVLLALGLAAIAFARRALRPATL